MKLLHFSAALAASLSAAVAFAADKADYYVSPRGNDAWSGRIPEPNAARSDGPLATVSQAQDRIRNAKLAGPNRAGPLAVAIRGGTYFLAEPLRFTPEDSGTRTIARSLLGLRRRAAGHQRRPADRGMEGRCRGPMALPRCPT